MKQVSNINPALSRLATPVTSLYLDAQNARAHGERSISAIAASLTEFGQQKPIVALKNGVVIAGNGTLTAAQQLGWTHVAAVRFEDAAKARAFAIADNRTAELSEWDPKVLAATLDELSQLPGWDPTPLGFTEEEAMKLVAAGAETPVVVGAPPPPKPAVPGAPGPVIDPSNVRMVQLFLDDKSHPEFMHMVKLLTAEYKTANTTETVLQAVLEIAGARAARSAS